MSLIDDLKMYRRFAWGLRGFLRHAITLDEARAILRRRLEEREAAFLRMVERGIYGYPRSPYLPLLELAHCELGDLQAKVRQHGLDKTLRALREAGVYISFEEFKGREPIVRHGSVFPVQANDFDNPYLTSHYYGETGGSTGAGTRVALDLDHLAAQAPHQMVFQAAHGLLNVPTAVWHNILPDSTGIESALRRARFGHITHKWFSPINHRNVRPALKNRLATHATVILSRLWGFPFPWPEWLELDQAGALGRWAARAAAEHGTCLVAAGNVSRALRVCLAAREEGLDLTGVVFSGGGEPPTPAKARAIQSVGARWIPGYWITEAGIVGQGCADPVDENDNHLFTDAFSLIQYPRQVPGLDLTVDAFNFTTLLPTAPKLMLNVESDDYGLVETRRCGCALEEIGYAEHVREIRSFRKLTGEGVTLVGSEMIHILEDILPGRFGGTPLDYQLLEEEDEQGFTRVSLLVSPSIEITDEQDVIDTVFHSLRHGSVAADQARAIWSQARTLRVKRIAPILTTRGKLLPLHVIRRATPAAPGTADPIPLSDAR